MANSGNCPRVTSSREGASVANPLYLCKIGLKLQK
jgi:hypothetical protein